MKHFAFLRRLPLLVALPLILAGCWLVTGTFLLAITLVKGEDLFWTGDYYYHHVDFTQEQVWEDHGDNIKYIDVVGFELWADNDLATAETYDLYLTDQGSALDSSSAVGTVESDATQVLSDVPIKAGPGMKTYISYPQSFAYLVDVDKLRDLTKKGGFKLFLVPSNSSTSLTVDSLKVVVTFTAGA